MSFANFLFYIFSEFSVFAEILTSKISANNPTMAVDNMVQPNKEKMKIFKVFNISLS